MGGTGTSPNPVEILLSSLGQCLAVGYAAAATVQGVKLNSLKIDLEGDLNLLPFLGLGKKGDHAGYNGVTININIYSDGSKEQIEVIHEHVIGTSPVGTTLQNPVPLVYNLISTNKK